MIQRSVLVPLAWHLLAIPLAAAPAKSPTITLVYTTAETSTSASVVWNTNVASDSLLQYSTSYPVPADAPWIYVATPVTVHDFELQGLTPATLYHFKVTSCAKRRCATATGSFDTYPSCPDEVPPVSGSWQRVPSPNVGAETLLTNQLLAITAISENDVWAVGWSQVPDGPPYIQAHVDSTLRRQRLAHRAESEPSGSLLQRALCRVRDVCPRRLGRGGVS